MRIVCISDTHSLPGLRDLVIPDADVLVHAGDLTGIGSLEQLVEFNDWIGSLPHRHKLVIAGNHDAGLAEGRKIAESLLDNCTYLEDSEVVIRGVRFYGTPWQDSEWAFCLPSADALHGTWTRVPKQTDVLITHAPPRGILDHGIGIPSLLERVRELRPRLHVFGHVHEGYGMTEQSHTLFVNASIADIDYDVSNRPIVVDL